MIALMQQEAARRNGKLADLEILARTVASRCSNTFIVLVDRGVEVRHKRPDPQG